MFTLLIHLSHVHFINSFPACSLCLCSLKWSGLLPFARLVEATRAEMVEGERRGINSKRVKLDHSLLSCLVDRWRPETHISLSLGRDGSYSAGCVDAAGTTIGG